MPLTWFRKIDKEKIKKYVIWLLWDFSGLRFIASKVWPPLADGDRKPATFLLWIIGIYIALFGVASQRYENRVDIIENRANAIFAQLGTSAYKKALGRIPKVQNMDCPIKPELENPFSVFGSLFFDSKYEMIISLLKETVEDWKNNLEGVNLEKAQLQGVNLKRASLRGAILRGANLQILIFHSPILRMRH